MRREPSPWVREGVQWVGSLGVRALPVRGPTCGLASLVPGGCGPSQGFWAAPALTRMLVAVRKGSAPRRPPPSEVPPMSEVSLQRSERSPLPWRVPHLGFQAMALDWGGP